MRIVEDEGFCTSCGRYAEIKIGQENFSLLKKDLDNYKKYKDIYVFRCRTCGFISTDISGEEGVLCGGIQNGYEFNQILNYAYLQGIDKELYDNHSADVPANLYEAYSLICERGKNYESLVRTLNKSIELKVIMARKYKISKDELGGEEENDDEYEKLDQLIKESIQTNRKQIDYYYDFIENKNLFVKLVYIENLVNMGEMSKALKHFTDITRKVKLENDLEDYFKHLLKI